MFQIINDLGSFKNKKGDIFSDVSRKVLEVGIEPTLPKELDFESSASTNSATRAIVIVCKSKKYFMIVGFNLKNSTNNFIFVYAS